MVIKYDISFILRKISHSFKFNTKLVEESIASINWENFKDNKAFSLVFNGIYSKFKFDFDSNLAIKDKINFNEKEICVIHFHCDNTVHYLSFIYPLHDNKGTVIINYLPNGMLMDSVGNGMNISDRILTYPVSDFPMDCESGDRHYLVSKIEDIAKKINHNTTKLNEVLISFRKTNNGNNYTFTKNDKLKSIDIRNVFFPDIRFSYSLDDNTRLSPKDHQFTTTISFNENNEIIYISHRQKNITGKFIYVFESKFNKDFQMIEYKQEKFNQANINERHLHMRWNSQVMSYDEEVRMFKFIANKENQSMKEVLPELTTTGVYDFTSDNFKERMSMAEILTF